jgi:hypothetical protein
MNSTTNDSSLDLLQSIPQTLYNSVGLALFIIGTIGNLLDIISFSRLESLNTLASSLFLLASFSSSQVVLITGLLSRIIIGLTGNNSLFNSLFVCKARSMVKIASVTFTMTCVCLAAIDRYFHSCLDLRRQRWITLKQTRLTIVIIALVCLVGFSPYAVFYTVPTESSCSVVNPIFAYFQPCLALLFYNLGPLIVLTIICILTWQNLGQQVTFYLRGNVRSYDQVTRMVIAQIIVIFVTTFPAIIWQIYTIATQAISKSSLRLAQEAIINAVVILPAYCPYTIMFYVYLTISPVFRRNVKSLFFCTHPILPMRNVELARKQTLQQEPRRPTLTP